MRLHICFLRPDDLSAESLAVRHNFVRVCFSLWACRQLEQPCLGCPVPRMSLVCHTWVIRSGTRNGRFRRGEFFDS